MDTPLEIEDTPLRVPTDFSFPGSPYTIQKEFMESLFSALDKRALGIFESPTGTGKSLSLLCSSLTWLENREEQRIRDLKGIIATFDEEAESKASVEAENWITAQHQLRTKKAQIFKAKRELKFIEDSRLNRKKLLDKRTLKQINEPKVFRSNPIHDKKPKNDTSKVDDTQEIAEEDATYFNEDFAPNLNSDSDGSDEESTEDEPEFFPLKVIFASRTHSQLSQFVNELKKTSFAGRVTSVTLGSRQTMCINSTVRKLNSTALINERCLDLQKKSKGKKTSETKRKKECSGCEFFNHSGIEDLKRRILREPLDIEELVTASKKEFKACPYYASRKAAKEAQLLLVPYNSILHSGTREALGLNVENSVILLDEAHNIIESISNMCSTSVTESQLEECSKGLKIYITRYMSRFNAKNLLQLKQIGFILKSLLNYLKKNDTERVFQTWEFKSEISIEDFDIFELMKFVDKSRLVFKLRGYMQLQESQKMKATEQENKGVHEKAGGSTMKKATTSGQSILNFSAFIKSLSSSCANGRIIQDHKAFKFLILNPGEDFSKLVKSSRSIILAGGTIKPYEDIDDQLFHSARNRIVHFSCDHVIPKENLICLALSHGPTSTCFDFTFKNRNSPLLLEELSRLVQNVVRIVPRGVVIFLPSYKYEDTFYTYLTDSGYLNKIEQRKKVFREPKDQSTDKILADYTRQIRNNSNGALLLAVVGGKLSEGINFADDLGRCVLVVGLPYPDITSVEIKEKINFISNKFGPEKSKQLLPNACFKAVNQSIGRAVRHSEDYSAIILVDHRFLGKDSQAQLPEWILKSFTPCSKFGQCVATLAKFFNSKNVSTTD